MDTTRIRNFAVAARMKLLAGVDERLNAMGFAADGSVAAEDRPVKVEGGARFRGAVLSDTSFFGKWTALEADVKARGREEVRNAVAYTWFNRFCAIRIMAKRGFIPVALEYVGNRESRTPAMVASMRAGDPLPSLTPQERVALDRIRLDDTKTTEQFAILVSALCRNTPVLKACFGVPHDYTALLLPQDVLAPGGFVDQLNDPDVLSDEDYCADELIGWLYQYYISERKQEVFDSFKTGKKAAPEDIPAATQIFTPNWIVKYMVENSLGRLAIENGLGGDFTKDWKYLIREEDGTHPPCLKVDSPEELTMADVACGSGHILLEGFRHLFAIYTEAGYSRRQAVECILTKNLVGIDLDMRARQLSQFALLLAAMSVDPSFADAAVLPRVFDMEGTLAEGHYARTEIAQVLSVQEDTVLNELQDAFALLTQAHNLGSIMKFKISGRTRGILAVKVAELEQSSDELAEKYLPSFRLILVLTAKYATIVTNPPYMGDGNMNPELKGYLEEFYRDGKSDLMTAFMLFAAEHVCSNGRWAMIDLPSWMFIGSYERLRRQLIPSQQIVGLVHNGRGVFGSDFGSVTFVFQNTVPFTQGVYRRLFKEHVQVRSLDVIHALYQDSSYGYYRAYQQSFLGIPGCAVGYWISGKLLKAFSSSKVDDFAHTVNGFTTGKNELFLRLWSEISINRVGFDLPNLDVAKNSHFKWFPYNKGGAFRKWYGNNDYLINWANDGEDLKSFGHLVPRSLKFMFHESVSWSKISSGKAAFRYKRTGTMFDVAGLSLIPKNDGDCRFFLGLLNSIVSQYCLELLSPTMNFETGHISEIPICEIDKARIGDLSDQCRSISVHDWDSFEVSWDFTINPLVEMWKDNSHVPIRDLYEILREKWRSHVLKLRKLEVEINDLFIESYGLREELSSDVPIHEVSLSCNPWYRYGVKQDEKPEQELLERQRTDTIKELVSYSIGCLMGRYSLVKEGLILASQGETIEDYWKKVGGDRSHSSLEPDDDGIIPLIAGASAFTDNGPKRVVDFMRAAFGVEHLNENLNFIEECLGGTLEQYLVKDFWKDHKKTYQNRPIYWLFASKKGAFQCLVYMHRMDAYTVSKIRNDYLLPHIEFLRTRIAADSARGADLTAKERTALKKMQQAEVECLEYDERLHVVADKMQAIDLDDGVVVNYAKFGDVVAKIK